MSIDSYFKTIAYACLYKAGGEDVDQRKQEPEMCEALEELMADVIEKRVKEESDRVTQEVTQ